jgi:hypothetical protein
MSKRWASEGESGERLLCEMVGYRNKEVLGIEEIIRVLVD